MNGEDRLVAQTVFEQGPSGPEPVDIGKAMIACPLSGAKTGVKRPKNELTENLRHVEADSLEGVCEAFDVRIAGQFQDGDEAVEVNIPVRSEDDFTPDGLVRKHARLRALFVGSCTGDSVAAELTGNDRELLNDAEIGALESVVTALERSMDTEER